MSYPQKYVFQKKQKYVKVFKMITNKDEAKTMTEHISGGCKCKFNSTTCNSKQKWNNKTCKNYKREKHTWNPSTCICNNSKYLKSVADILVTRCNEIIIVMNNLATKKDKYYRNKCYKYCFNKCSY